MTISGNVENFAEISQKGVKLEGLIDKEIKATVTITPTAKYPFKITEIRPESSENISCKLEQGEKSSYLLTIQNIKKIKGSYRDSVIIKTDSKIRPEIRIKVFGILEDLNKADKVPDSNAIQQNAGQGAQNTSIPAGK